MEKLEDMTYPPGHAINQSSKYVNENSYIPGCSKCRSQKGCEVFHFSAQYV